MALELSTIQFNHNSVDKRQSALNIRLDYDSPLLLPEWHSTAAGVLRSAPAAYAVHTVDESRLIIAVGLAWTGSPISKVQVRAIQPEPTQLPWWLLNLSVPLPPQQNPLGYASWYDYLLYEGYRRFFASWQQSIWEDSNVLGEVKPTWCPVKPDGMIPIQALRLQNVRLRSRGVGVFPVIWRWQYRLQATDPWSDFAVSHHEIYTTLHPPTLPWTQQPFNQANTSLPWASVLAYSCRWAAGSHTADTATGRITGELFELGNGLFEYGCPIWAHEMYANTPFNLFDCTAFVERLQGGVGNGPYVNCTDCACIVSTFANALGANLWQARMGDYVPAFRTRPILAIGSRRWQTPCGWNLGFSFHEVAWKGSCTEIDSVFDACLAVDGNLNPFSSLPIPILPSNMLFGFPGDNGYRSMLAELSDQLICQPRPQERRRRILI